MGRAFRRSDSAAAGARLIFRETAIDGAFVIDSERPADHRGFFVRTFDAQEFASRGLVPVIAQCSLSYNAKKGTLRGMHYQIAPHEEAKLVRCVRGAIYDVVLDVRSNSRTYGKWEGVELSASNRLALYIPPGAAHGFVTLEDDCELFYSMSEFYHPESARGVLWNDPAFGIEWPVTDPILSEADRNRGRA